MKRAAAVDWNPTGTPVAWFYDPPWAIPFLRRNDVAVPVAATLTASSGRWQDRTEGAPTSAATSSRRFSVSSWSCPFGWAATAFHLLTGTQPFKHSNPAVVISRHLNSPLPALADTRAELAALDPVLAVALAKNPDDRFARCADFAHALAEQAAPGDASSAAPTTPARASRKAASPAAQPPGKSAAVCGSPKRWLTLAIALAAIVVASAVALAWHPCSADLVPVLVSPRRVGVVVLVVEFLLLFALFLGRLGGVFWRGRRIVVWFHRNRVSR